MRTNFITGIIQIRIMQMKKKIMTDRLRYSHLQKPLAANRRRQSWIYLRRFDCPSNHAVISSLNGERETETLVKVKETLHFQNSKAYDNYLNFTIENTTVWLSII